MEKSKEIKANDSGKEKYSNLHCPEYEWARIVYLFSIFPWLLLIVLLVFGAKYQDEPSMYQICFGFPIFLVFNLKLISILNSRGDCKQIKIFLFVSVLFIFLVGHIAGVPWIPLLVEWVGEG